MRKDAFWFGEAQSRVVVSVKAANLAAFKQAAEAAAIAITNLGLVSAGQISVNGTNWGSITDWKNKYDTAIEKRLS
jgi:phosphoribosylformylglycinamidine synthase